MRLKVPPKAALGAIDALIYEGFKLEREHGETLRKGMAITVTEADYKQIMDWHDKTAKALRNIFLDFAPVFFFWKAIEDVKVEMKDGLGYRPFIGYDDKNYVQILEGGLHILGEYYRQLSEQVFTPLFYAAERAQICFYASVCPLEPDSNESTLCRFMFKQYSYHEWVEMEDIFADGFGGNREEFGSKDRTTIKNACDGVSRKTNTAFGFSIFKINKTQISLNLPARFLHEDGRFAAS